MSTVNVRELLGEEYLAHFFDAHVIPEKFRSSKPDGIYDLQDRNSKWRDVIVDGCTIHTITKMWLDVGGPKGLPSEFRRPWGAYRSESEATFDYGE